MKNGFMSVNTKLGAGRAFLRSLYQQYADWGVDFGKTYLLLKTIIGRYIPLVMMI